MAKVIQFPKNGRKPKKLSRTMNSLKGLTDKELMDLARKGIPKVINEAHPPTPDFSSISRKYLAMIRRNYKYGAGAALGVGAAAIVGAVKHRRKKKREQAIKKRKK